MPTLCSQFPKNKKTVIIITEQNQYCVAVFRYPTFYLKIVFKCFVIYTVSVNLDNNKTIKELFYSTFDNLHIKIVCFLESIMLFLET
jgi:hypothetical protein